MSSAEIPTKHGMSLPSPYPGTPRPSIILFLDFDGVLHPLKSAEAFTRQSLLDALLADTPQIEIVLTTSWRQIYPLNALREKLSPTIAARVIGVTPTFPIGLYRETGSPVGPVREHECRTWLKENARDATPWLALDDQRELFSESAPVVWCDPQTGLTDESIQAIREWVRECLSRAESS